MDLNCYYTIIEIRGSPHYEASIKEAQITKEGTVINSIEGTHVEGMSAENVTSLVFYCGTVKFIPKGICKIFPNLDVFIVYDCGLEKISAGDLDGLENLKGLQIQGNPITSLPSNLLKNMKQLESFLCEDNQLQHLSAKLLNYENAHLLKIVSFRNNKCINRKFPGDCSTLNELKDVIASNCKPPKAEFENFTNNLKVFEKFWRLWSTGDLSDFTVESGNKKFKVHKSMLGIQSSVIAKAVQIDMEESKTNRMRIDDFSSDAVEEFLRFCYTGEVSEVNAMEVFALAAKYDIPELKKTMEGIIAENIDDENALDVLNLGNLHESELIMKAAFNKIKTILSDIELVDEMIKKPSELLDLVEAKRNYHKGIEAVTKKYKKTIDEKNRK